MTIATETDAGTFPSIRRFSQNLIRELFSARAFEKAGQTEIAPDLETDPLADLLEQIDNGYTVEETGEHVNVPGYARAYVRTLVKTGGWG